MPFLVIQLFLAGFMLAFESTTPELVMEDLVKSSIATVRKAVLVHEATVAGMSKCNHSHPNASKRAR